MKITKVNMRKNEIRKIKQTAKKRKNRRLSDSEAARLMAKAKVELGLIDSENNDNEDILNYTAYSSNDLPETRQTETVIIDSSKLNVGSYHVVNNPEPELEINQLIEQILSGLGERSLIRYEYEKAIKEKNIRKHKDKLAVLSYLFSNKSIIPMCLLSRKQKTNAVRKIVKTKGDVKVHPERIIPDKEFLRMMGNKERSKLDAFDKMDLDKKIEWARYASITLGAVELLDKSVYRIVNEFGSTNITFAMKYACKMSNIPEFKGIFNNPYWILSRVYRHYDRLTSREYNTFVEMAYKHLGIRDVKTLPILNSKQALERLMPTLKNMKLEERFEKDMSGKKTTSKLNMIKELLLHNLS